MNRLYVVSVGSLEIRGLISPGELPDLVSVFYGASARRGVTAEYCGEGLFVAEKDNVTLTLTIGSYHKAFPSRMVADVLEEVMDQVFL